MEVSDRLCPLYIVSEYIYPTVFSKPKSSFSKSLEKAFTTILLKIDMPMMNKRITIRPEEHKDYKSIVSLILRSFQEGTDYSDGTDIIALVEEIRDSQYNIFPTSGYPMKEPRCMMCQQTYEGSLDGIHGYIVYDMYFNA